jgi:hypothetical protein
LAHSWSSGPESALQGLAYTGFVYSLDHRDDLIQEVDQAIEVNNDPEEHVRLQILRNYILSSVPIMTNLGIDMVSRVERQIEPDGEGGHHIYFLFKTENGLSGLVHTHKNKYNRWAFLEAGGLVDGSYKPWNLNESQIAQLAAALYEKLGTDWIDN